LEALEQDFLRNTDSRHQGATKHPAQCERVGDEAVARHCVSGRGAARVGSIHPACDDTLSESRGVTAAQPLTRFPEVFDNRLQTLSVVRRRLRQLPDYGITKVFGQVRGYAGYPVGVFLVGK
jgi:hypothetical protein